MSPEELKIQNELDAIELKIKTVREADKAVKEAARQ